MSRRRHTVSMLERHLAELKHGFANQKGHERAAYLFCSRAVMPEEIRFIVRAVEIVPPPYIASSSTEHVSISSSSYVRAIVRADQEDQAIILVHSHPGGFPSFSEQDDREESEFFRTAFERAPNGPHGSMIVVGTDSPVLLGRIWLSDHEWVWLDRIRVVGKRMRIFDRACKQGTVLPWTNRQVLAFGEATQELLATLHVGVVGAGGTGSAVCEQLIRLGVGRLTVVDDQEFEDTNVNRLYGSGLSDNGLPKVEIVRRQASRIGTGTKVNAVRGSVCDRHVAEALRSCDVVFGCTDDHFGRVILNRLALWYYIPAIDMAVAVDSEAGVIREVIGRVTLLLPGNACLRCRGRVNQRRATADMLWRRNPAEYESRVQEGYAPELRLRDPAVIMFTTGIAARAMTELVQLLTGFMGDDRTASEVVERFHESEVRKNSAAGLPGCDCTSPDRWGRGDQELFLGLTW